MLRTTCSFLGSWRGWVITLVVAGVAAYLLWAHTGHVVSVLPFLLFLACPLMHIFGHGHGGHGDHGERRPREHDDDKLRTARRGRLS